MTRSVPCLLLFIAGLGSVPAAAQDVPIVYVRCARTDADVVVSGDVTVAGETRRASRRMTGIDIYDVLPDVSHFRGGFSAPCDLVYREADGAERVLYDCSSTSTDDETCAAMDPVVSFDGRAVAFSVFRGSLSRSNVRVNSRVLDPSATSALARNPDPAQLPNQVLATREAQLHLVDVATGTLAPLPYVEGQIDAGPAFLPDGRIAFTSTRDTHNSTMVWGSNSSGRGTRIWTMDADGRNVDLASHHSLSTEEHPYILRDGRLAYSSWQIFGGLPFRHTNGSIGGFTTLANLFHLYTQHPDGAHNFAFYGQHSGDHGRSYFGTSHNAAHFLTQSGDGRVWFADYYRANNNGLGTIVGVMPEPDGREGIGPMEAETHADVYAPRDARRLSGWTTNGDSMSAPMTAPGVVHPNYADPLPFRGKLGHPAALPDGGLIVAWGKGACSTVAGNRIFDELGMERPPLTSGSGQGTAMNVITSLGMDTPGCDVGIYRTTLADPVRSEHPSDLQMIVDHREWHELMARPVVPYAAIFDVERPDIIERSDRRVARGDLETGTPFGLLGAASIVDRETHPRDGIHFAGEHQFHGQGTDTIDYDDEELCGVRILGLMPNRGRNTHRELANPAGERVSILGEIAVRNRDAAGGLVRTADGAPDTSFLLRMPANVPYLMQAIDCDGRTLNTDQSWQSLRPGEMKTCGGCHVHSREPRYDFGETYAASAAYPVPHLGEGQVPLLAGTEGAEVAVRNVEGYGLRIDFAEDIMPIFERRCVSCHGGDAPMGNLALDRAGIEGIGDTDTPSTWWCLVGDRSQRCLPGPARFVTDAAPRAPYAFRRPQLTRYIRAFNSRASLLYWKAAGERTDNRTDETFTGASAVRDRDLDFGPAHPTEITEEELGLLSRWIDIGAPGGPGEGRDTQRPTLHLSAIADAGAVTGLRVGTVDLGTGIAPDTLTVCVLDAAGGCDDLSGAAHMHGVAAIELAAPLGDPDQEVLARVEDVAGNVTEVRRTVRWLLDSPPPPPPLPDAGPLPLDAGARRDGGVLPDGALRADGGAAPMTEGCGCRIGGASAGSAWVGLIACVALGWRRRRRSRRPVSRQI